MKKLITTCVMLTALTMVSFAQSRATKSSVGSGSAAASSAAAPAATKASVSSPEQLAEKHAKEMQAKYKLNADQYKYIYATDLDFYTQEAQIKANGGKIGEGQSSQMKMGRDQRYQNVMTPEQFAKYQSANQQAK